MSKAFSGDFADNVAFPLGGIGAGMFCLEGTGAISHLSLRNRPDVFSEPCTFAAVCIKGGRNVARVIEGPVPRRKAWGTRGAGEGLGNHTYGLPRFAEASFQSRYPFATVQLTDPCLPISVAITGWSPFSPGASDDSSLPVAALEYRFKNVSRHSVSGVFSFNTRNFMALGKEGDAVLDAPGGFILRQEPSADEPWREGACQISVDSGSAVVNCHWFRGDWFDPLTMAWREVESGTPKPGAAITEGKPSPGASVSVPFDLSAGAEVTLTVRFAWYVPVSDMNFGPDRPAEAKTFYKPWYAGRFADVREVAAYWDQNYRALRNAAREFSDTFFNSTLPSEVIEAVEANLAILKSPTVLRQTDGKLWCWEGCGDSCGCCSGSCTHVWNYAQAIPHLFPDLERTLRETEFGASQDERGHQAFRSSLPIRAAEHDFHAAADGQLGGIVKVYRDWRICGDTEWLRSLWPRVRKSLDYCIVTWDPDGEGLVKEPHHNTYDIEFWGPDGMCTSFYLAALKAATLMGQALGEDVAAYAGLLEKGLKAIDDRLYNGEYYIQSMEWADLRAGDPADFGDHSFAGHYSEEAVDLMRREGPKYQYGNGCLTDGVLGFWLAEVSGIEDFANVERVAGHLAAVHKYNLKRDLSEHANPQRPTYAFGDEGGLLLCTWPHEDKLSLPFVYSDEVWTGIEHQSASHMMLRGLVRKGLDVVRTSRERYDGKKRNPFNEYECGHWYARAMASYAYLYALSGARYDAVEKTLYLKPRVKGDFRSFLCTATGYGTVGVRDGQPFLDVVHGTIPYERIEYAAFGN
jgi:uncharacterized protein (DUF608 family)